MLISLVCVFICVFGFVSMVSLTCEERRKEIAIRKVSGATVKDILDIFFKEYLTLLAVGAVIAFPVGYYIMKQWIEQYVHQTEISAWIYAAILLALILAIVLCVGGKVYKTSRENPVIAIKEN
jgi:ABC-type antimicrobial peptide transport system permease subunit